MTSAERKAVGFFAVLAAAGAGARALGLGDPPGLRPPTSADRLALQHQLEAVDSLHGKRAGARAGSPSPQEPVSREPRGPVDVSRPVDVNQADTAELNRLPGIGPALARRIVADRAARGGYASMAELSRVPGIGAALEGRLAGAVTFTPGGRPSSGSPPGPAGTHRGVPAGASAGWPAP